MFTDKDSFVNAFSLKFLELKGKPVTEGTLKEFYETLVRLIKDNIGYNWAAATERYSGYQSKQVYYFSMEFLIGRILEYYLINFGVQEIVRDGLEHFGIPYEDVMKQEPDAGLGNGGLGRLAACFLDSMAFLKVHGHGNGIRYKYGLFEQKLVDGYQVEVPDNWLKNGYQWELRKPEKAVVVRFKGKISAEIINDKLTFIHENYDSVLAVPYDIPISGFDNNFLINNLRLWSSEPLNDEIDLVSFNLGDYSKAISYKTEVEAISNILYPESSSIAGKELRLKQEYFFVAAGVGSIVRSFKKRNHSFKDFTTKISIHINDTHPALCVPELMRVLMDEEGLSWDEAWNITVNSCSFTNHTVLPEALESWEIDLFRYILPRIYLIIEEIDRRFRMEINRRFPENKDLANKTAIIRGGVIDMAGLAVIGCHSVNGVSALHSEILKNHLFNQYYKIYPAKFGNVTNGMSHRRFLLKANPHLSQLISKVLGDQWKYDANELEKLLIYKNDDWLLKQLEDIRYHNKCRLAKYIYEQQGIVVDPRSVFDVQVKRVHAYKRQLMNILRIMDLYNQLKEHRELQINPFTFIFGGKAAPGYHFAKVVIKLINSVAQIINEDKDLNGLIKVVFLREFNVSLGELIYPASDISEQISTASREASGTGNMKFMINGAITLGTLDGANVEIRNAVGDDNIEIFGLTSQEVLEYYHHGGYNPWDEYIEKPRLKKVVDQLINGFFDKESGDFRVLHDSLLRDNDQFFILKDFSSYNEAWQRLNKKYSSKKEWFSSALTNIAKAGIFASDRSIRDYADDIWKVKYRTFEQRDCEIKNSL